jgi:hypothetical protein
MKELLVKYWPLVAAAGVLVAQPVFKFLKSKLGNIKLPKLNLFKSKAIALVADDMHIKDQSAIDWLANRAVDVGDETLIAEMESVNSKFYNIHRAMRKSASSTVAD